ncbi:hypothetical protein DFP73DRAFT_591950 [Morchella snyderi]|nr:hypothetical protein DFP73DRAFT_591950 [Morchella snyderi]
MFSKAFWLNRASRGNGGALEDSEDSFDVCFRNIYKVITVPVTYKVQPLANRMQHEFELASTYGIVKTLAALVQLAYSSYELYAARATQFDKFGYGAYSLTIIPYVLMSMVNLAASLSRPSYPSRYFVYYRGIDIPEAPSTELEAITIADTASTAEEGPLLLVDGRDRDHREAWMKEVESVVTGHVGYAYGDPYHSASKSRVSGLQVTVVLGLIFIAMLLPYILIYALTRFQKRENTVWQRSWFLSALVFGQVFPFLVGIADDRIKDFFQEFFPFKIPRSSQRLLFALLLSAPTVGMFVIVARTILQDQVCTEI